MLVQRVADNIATEYIAPDNFAADNVAPCTHAHTDTHTRVHKRTYTHTHAHTHAPWRLQVMAAVPYIQCWDSDMHTGLVVASVAAIIVCA